LTAAEIPTLWHFWQPRFWPTWLLYLAMRIVAWLPFRLQIRAGSALGTLLLRLQHRQRKIARINLAICFPEFSSSERSTLLRQHFRSIGLSMVEMAIGWYSAKQKLHRLVQVDGKEHLDAAIAKGHGVILVSAHFTALEVGVAILDSLCEHCTCLYRPQRNALMDTMILRGRSRFAQHHVPRNDVRSLLKRLRANDVVAYLPDQTYLGNQSALLPFFGEPAMTNIATPKLAQISGAEVLTYWIRRASDDSGYSVEIGPPFENFPGDDPQSDASRIFARLERFIRKNPEQYLWVYKKFKNRPPPLINPYADI
jgi:KDO2-lipid IV(A) lauroyltransferase